MPLMLGDVMLASAGALLVYVLALWLLSLPLRDVSIEVEGGQFISIVGASGCGKTTLLRIADGLIQARIVLGTFTIGGVKLSEAMRCGQAPYMLP